MIYLFLLVLTIVVLGAIIMGFGSWVADRSNKYRRELQAANQTLRKSERALAQIANGTSGNDMLTAQIALDEINNYNDRKELA